MKSQILSLVFLVLGAFGGYKIANKPPQTSDDSLVSSKYENYKIKYDELKAKFKSLSDNEIESYINENDPALKTQKADEMLTKLLKLFLIDVGLRLESQNNRLQQSKSNYKENKVISPTSMPLAGQNDVETGCEYTKKTCEQRYGVFKASEEKVNWKQKEAGLSGVSSDEKIASFLDEVKVDNLFENLKNSYKPKLKLYNQLVGFFAGDVVFDDKQPTLKMEFELKNDLVYKKGEYYGTFRIQLFRDGSNVSNSNGDGRLTFLKSYNEASKGFILHTGRLYFQLYFANSRRFLFGNVYEKKDVSTYSKVANVILNRK